MANEYLKRTPTSSGNRKQWTWAGWIKINKDFGSSNYNTVWSVAAGTSSNNSDRFHLYHYSDGRWVTTGTTSFSAVFTGPGGGAAHSRDPGSWIHICLSCNTTISSSTPDQIQRFWVNGVEYIYDDAGNISQNANLAINGLYEHYIGTRDSSPSRTYDGQMFDLYLVDGQALTPDVFGFYKDGDGYVSAGSTQATDFRPGQWMPHSPTKIKKDINRRGGFGVNGFYLPMNDSSNPGADFHCDPNSIIKLKGEDLPQPRNGAPTTSDAFVSQLREEKGTLGFDGVVKFDGTGDYLSLPKASFQMLHKLTSSWTIEGYIFKTADSQGTIFDTGGSSSATIGTAVYINSGGDFRLRVRQATGATVVSENLPGSVALNRWQHIAISYDETSIRVFIEGKLLKTTAYNTQSSTDSTQDFSIGVYDAGGAGFAGYFTGFISNLRVIDGTALYTANFTAPTEPLTNVTNTKLLCCNSTKAPESATVAPTIGTYVQNWTENTSSDLDGYNGIGAIYDGQLGTSNRGGNSSSHDGSYETLFDGQSVAVSSTIEIYWNGVGSGQRVIRVNGTTEINGGSGALAPGWDSHSFSGTVTKLEVKTANTGSYGISAVRIDSNILTTPLTANGDAVATRNELTGSMVLAVPGIALENTNTELVTNGTFNSNITGWTGYNSTPTWDSVNQRLAIDAATEFDGAETSSGVSVSASTNYTLEVDVNLGTAGGVRLQVRNSANSASLSNLDVSGSGTYAVNFASGSNTSVYIRLITSAGNTGTAYFDNVSLKLAVPVRDYSADIKGSGTNKTLTSNGDAGVGYELGNYYGSAMTFDGTDDQITAPSSTDLQLGAGDFTLEAWVNYSSGNGADTPIALDNGTATFAPLIGYLSTNLGQPLFYLSSTGSSWDITGNGGLSFGSNVNVNQWTHLAVVREGTNLSIYRDGVCANILNDLGTKSIYQGTNQISFGRAQNTNLFDGQIQDVRLYKGLAKYKGGFDVPKPYTPVGIEAFRTVADTCKNNFATLNPLIGAGIAANDNVPALKDGNLYYDNANQSWTISTIGVSSGKYYAEFMMSGGTLGSNIGVCGDNRHGRNNQQYHAARGISYIRLNNPSVTKDYNATSATETANDADLSYESGSIVGITIDFDNKEIKYYKNGTLILTDSTPASYTPVDFAFYFLAFRTNDGASPLGSNWADVIANFGQNPTFSGNTSAGTNADDSGKGLFKYAPPTGFLALCEDNLPTPAIADPGDYMRTVLYTGSGSARNVNGLGFKPDFVWMKGRTGGGYNHILNDSVRGPRKTLFTNNTLAEYTDRGVSSFDDDGFSLIGGSGSDENATNVPYVAWCWKAGGAAVSNTDGTLTSQVSVNQDAGFSIVKFTGQTSGTGTVGHGLGKKPAFWMYKPINNTTNWYMYHQSLGASAWLNFTTSAATTGNAAAWGGVEPTSTVLTHGSGLINQGSCILYAWAEIEGFSKFGSYVGNASTDGPFVYCGFKPAFIMFRNASATGNWVMSDSSRDSSNPVFGYQVAEGNAIEERGNALFDSLSNGFKIRNSWTSFNGSTNTITFMAFAESPFQTANAK